MRDKMHDYLRDQNSYDRYPEAYEVKEIYDKKVAAMQTKLDQFRWRDVKVEPPEAHTLVLVMSKRKFVRSVNSDSIDFAINYTHWMPMPRFEVEK